MPDAWLHQGQMGGTSFLYQDVMRGALQRSGGTIDGNCNAEGCTFAALEPHPFCSRTCANAWKAADDHCGQSDHPHKKARPCTGDGHLLEGEGDDQGEWTLSSRAGSRSRPRPHGPAAGGGWGFPHPRCKELLRGLLGQGRQQGDHRRAWPSATASYRPDHVCRVVCGDGAANNSFPNWCCCSSGAARSGNSSRNCNSRRVMTAHKG